MPADCIPLFLPGLQRLANLGLDVAQVLRQAGISMVARHPAKPSLTTRQYFALWAAIQAVSGDGLVGLRLGGEARVDQFDPATFAALHSDTFAQALARLARYKRLSCPEAIRVEHDGPLARFSVHWLWAKDAAPDALTDAAFANLHLLLRTGTGKPIAPLRVEWAAPRGEAARCADYFGCEVRTGAAHAALVYPQATLQERFVTANPDLIGALLPGLEWRLDAAPQSAVHLQVKAVLTHMMSGDCPSMEAVARHLCLSPRTL